jgi:hypothetical protein
MQKEYVNFIIDNISKEFDFKIPKYWKGSWDLSFNFDENSHEINYSKEKLKHDKYHTSKIKVKVKIIEVYSRCLKIQIEFDEFIEQFFININLNKSPNEIFEIYEAERSRLIINKLVSEYGYEYFINKELDNKDNLFSTNKENLNEDLNYIKIKKEFNIENLYNIVNSISINSTKICNAYCKLGLMNFNNDNVFPIYSWNEEKIKQLSFDELFDLHYQYNCK